MIQPFPRGEDAVSFGLRAQNPAKPQSLAAWVTQEESKGENPFKEKLQIRKSDLRPSVPPVAPAPGGPSLMYSSGIPEG